MSDRPCGLTTDQGKPTVNRSTKFKSTNTENILSYTVFLLLEPAGSISHRRYFTAGFIGISLNTDAGSIGGRV